MKSTTEESLNRKATWNYGTSALRPLGDNVQRPNFKKKIKQSPNWLAVANFFV